MDKNNKRVGISAIAIPDGIVPERKKIRPKDNFELESSWHQSGSLKLSIVLAPVSGDTVDLEKWPSEIQNLCNTGKLCIQFYDKGGSPFGDVIHVNQQQFHPSIRIATVQQDAKKMWLQIFGNCMDELYSLFTPRIQTLQIPKSVVRVGSSYLDWDATHQYDASQILQSLSDVRNAVLEAELFARLSAKEIMARLSIDGSLSSKLQAKIAVVSTAPFRFMMHREIGNLLAALALARDEREPVIRTAPHCVPSDITNPQVCENLSLREITRMMMEDKRKQFLNHGLRIQTDNKKSQSDEVIKLVELIRNINSFTHEPIAAFAYGTRLTNIVEALLLDDDDALAQTLALIPNIKSFSQDKSDYEMALTTIDLLMSVEVDSFREAFGVVRSTPSRVSEARRAQRDVYGLNEEKKTGVKTKYAGVRSHPTLGKLLNFVIDIQLKIDKLPPSGFVAASFGDFSSAPRIAYSYESKETKYHSVASFRPASCNEMAEAAGERLSRCSEKSLPLREGVVDLTVPDRFSLSCIDVHTLALGTRIKASEQLSAQLGGIEDDAISPRLVQQRGRGIQLLDSKAYGSVMARLIDAKDTPSPQTLFAEDLVLGYRAHVKRHKSGRIMPWRSLMARSVEYANIEKNYSDGKGNNWSSYLDFFEREHAYIRIIPRVEKLPPTDKEYVSTDRPIASSHIFTWIGDSLGMPAPQTIRKNDDNGVDSNPEKHLGIGLTYDYVKSSKGLKDLYRLPALRVNNGYEVGLVPVYLHGGGPTLTEAGQIYDSLLMLDVGDIKNLSALVRKLQGVVENNKVNSYLSFIWSTLDLTTQQSLINYTQGENGLLLIQALNKILQGPSIYKSITQSHNNVSDPVFRPETRRLIKEDPTGIRLILLNRLLLEDLFPDEIKKYKPLTLGTQGRIEQPFIFGQPNDVEAPLLLASYDDPLAKENVAESAVNETLETIVLRTGEGEDRNSIRRFLVPPRVEFSRAEQFGIFDFCDDAVPDGAFQSFLLRADTGDFPGHAKTTQEKKNNTSTKMDEHAREPQNRALILRYTGQNSQPDQPYYPDPMARNLGLAFERGDSFADGFPAPEAMPALTFWGGRDTLSSPLSAYPIELEFKRWPKGREGGRINREDATSQLHASNSFRRITIPKVTIELAQAEDVTLWLWCWPDIEQLMRARPEFPNIIARAYVAARKTLASSSFSLNKLMLNDDNQRQIELLAGYFEALASSGSGSKDIEKAYVAKFLNETQEIGLFHETDPDDLAKNLYIIKADVMRALFESSPFNGITGWRKIRLIHAVDKPLEIPRIAKLPNGRLSFAAVRVKPEQWDAQVNKKLCQLQDGAFDELNEPEGSKTFFLGELEFDRASTKSIRVEASWPILDYALAVRKEPVYGQPNKFKYRDDPQCVDRVLFEVNDIPRDTGKTPKGKLDLLKDELGRLRGLMDRSDNIGSSSTAARKLNLRIIATSRFTEQFKTEEKDRKPGDLGKFEVETRMPNGLQMSRHWAPSELDYEVIQLATARPPVPVIKRIVTIQPVRRERIGDTHLRLRKSFHQRIYLDESWRASGEDELLAILFAPSGVIDKHDYNPNVSVPRLDLDEPQPLGPDMASFSDEFIRFTSKLLEQKEPPIPVLPPNMCQVGDESTLCNLDSDTVNAVLPYITRWGADPTTAPMGTLEALISPNRFRGYVASYPMLKLPLPGTPQNTPCTTQGKFIDVGVLLYKPKLHEDTGEWFVDIGIDTGAAHDPFIRLALARYQPHRIVIEEFKEKSECKNSKDERDKIVTFDLALSEPLILDPRPLSAPRTVDVYREEQNKIVVHIQGVGYLKREPFGVTQAIRHLTDMPLQNVELRRIPDKTQANGSVLSFDESGASLRKERIQPIVDGAMLSWICQFDLPKTKNRQHYQLVIDETDLHISDKGIEKLKQSGGQDKSKSLGEDPDDLVYRPGSFSLTVDLDEE